jgi:uncharacterized protein involved in response to NO
MLIQINKPNPATAKKLAIFNLGFRPFFLGAGIFSVISIAVWMLVYFSYLTLNTSNISISQWHAHEMLYGFSMAVVAGFLLTAVKNWTGLSTASGRLLMVMFSFWCVARMSFLFGTALLPLAMAADLLFGLMFIVVITIPIVKAKQWMRMAVVSKVFLLWIGNILFYLGYLGIMTNGMQYSINGILLLFIGLILMIGRRVIPFFIERGNETRVQLKHYKWLDISMLAVFIGLFLNVIFIQNPSVTTIFSWTLFVLNGYRLFNWHAKGLWRVPLLWSLYLSAWLINVGFSFYGLQAQYSGLSIATLHIFTIGGIGLMTLSMMSRVSLGHTGRDIRKPHAWLKFAFAGLITSVLFRSILPMLTSQLYKNWVYVASIFWILSFAIFVVIYTPILLKPSADGAFG